MIAFFRGGPALRGPAGTGIKGDLVDELDDVFGGREVMDAAASLVPLELDTNLWKWIELFT